MILEVRNLGYVLPTSVRECTCPTDNPIGYNVMRVFSVCLHVAVLILAEKILKSEMSGRTNKTRLLFDVSLPQIPVGNIHGNHK